MDASFEAKKISTSTKLLSLFKLCDKNSDGLLDRSEFDLIVKALQAISPNSFEDCHADAVLSAFDKNGDGYIDYNEFIQWVMEDPIDEAAKPATVGLMKSAHMFLQPIEEARMERECFFELRKDENSVVIQDMGFSSLSDPHLLVVSMGSSSTQAYDCTGFAASASLGTSVFNEEALERLERALAQSGQTYTHVLMINSIGYSMTDLDPCLLDLEKLVERLDSKAKSGVKGADITKKSAHWMLATLRSVAPKAKIQVHNRAKDPTTKRSKFPQLLNDFSEALAAGRCIGSDITYDAIVDWGGKSYKVFVNSKRIGTEVMDANSRLCVGGQVDRKQLKEAIGEIESFVLNQVPSAKRILIAQTGKARELALKEQSS